MYDIVGDIHDYADELELLLAKLDYGYFCPSPKNVKSATD